MTEEIKHKLNELMEIRRQLIALANMQYTHETCPLRQVGDDEQYWNHNESSQMLFADGDWCWVCKFCGTEHGDSY